MDSSFLSTKHHSNFDHIAKILLIGETGAGKSTFINYLTNYFRHGTLSNLKIAIPCKYHPFPTEQFSHNELNINDNTQSKTGCCTPYLFTDSQTNKQYIFLDTPGLSDTRGIEQNESNINQIIDAITKLGNLTSVIIVVNGSTSRLTTHFRTVIACLTGHIPDIILENVLVILTNVKKHESSFDLKVLNLHGKVYPFYMQNGAFVSDPRTWKKSIHDELQQDWDHSTNQIKLILQTIDSFKQISIDSFLQLKQIRNDLKSMIHQARLEIIQIQKIQDELSQLDLALQQADRDTLTYQDHTRLHPIEKIELVDAVYHSTLCMNCNQVCHNNCRLDETTMIGAQIFSQCSVMLNGQCQQCRNHCPYTNHYHAKKTIQITQVNLYDILVDLKQKYDQAYANRASYQEKMFTIAGTKEILEKALKEKVQEIKSKAVKLCQICSSFNLAQEFKHLIQQLTSESNLIRNLEIKLQTEKLIKHLIKFTRLVEENQEKHRQNRPSMQIIDKEQCIEEKRTDIKHLKSSDLVKMYHNTTDHILITSILNELHQRAQGKATDPLVTSNEIMLINKNLAKHNQKTVQELSYSYHKLQQQIQNIIGSDILKIIDINSELLIENFIVQTLLVDKETNENNHQNTLSDITTRSVAPSITNAFPQSTLIKTSQSINSSPYPTTGLSILQTAPQLPYPNIESMPSQFIYPPPHPHVVPKPSDNHSLPIGFSHLSVAPYPSPNEPSFMPALPDDFSPILQDNQAFFRSESQRSISQVAKNTVSKLMPMPLNNTLQNQASDEHSSIPDVIPFNGNSLDPSQSFLTYLRLVDNLRLLSMYADANLKNNKLRKDAIYQELERRCDADYPLLIKERNDLYQEKIKLNEMRTIGELVIAQVALKRKIREYLKNDDFTLINDIPPELLIETSALNQLILSKGRI